MSSSHHQETDEQSVATPIDTVIQSNPSFGQLALLPPEIRQHIYVIALRKTYAPYNKAKNLAISKEPIFLVSKDVRAEARQVMYRGAVLPVNSPAELLGYIDSGVNTTESTLGADQPTLQPCNISLKLRLVPPKSGKYYIVSDADAWAKAIQQFKFSRGESILIFDLRAELNEPSSEIKWRNGYNFMDRVCARLWASYGRDVKVCYEAPQMSVHEHGDAVLYLSKQGQYEPR